MTHANQEVGCIYRVRGLVGIVAVKRRDSVANKYGIVAPAIVDVATEVRFTHPSGI